MGIIVIIVAFIIDDIIGMNGGKKPEVGGGVARSTQLFAGFMHADLLDTT